MQTFLIQVIFGNQFEDLYVSARSVDAAISKARKITTLKHRFARFVA